MPLAQNFFEPLRRDPGFDVAPSDFIFCQMAAAHAELPLVQILHAVKSAENTKRFKRGNRVLRVAINVIDARIADNAGLQPVDMPVVTGGPAAYFSTLPIKAMRLALQAEGIAAEVSQTAGTFVCNHVFFGLMHLLATQRGLQKSKGGFIHVPWLPEQSEPSMPLEEITRGIKLAVRVALSTKTDTAVGAGTLS